MLRYHRYEQPMPVPGRELPELRGGAGRRLQPNGVLSGALHTLGYFSTDVCLGSPPRSYDLIVDTGSSITAVPCSTCRQCGEHVCGRAGRFDLDASRTAQPVGCPTRPVPSLKCEPCNTNSCGYSVRYTEGSMIRGRVVSDLAHFVRAPARRGQGPGDSNSSLRVYFGCQTFETGMFQRQRADGILGLQSSRQRGKVPSMLSTLVSEYKVPNAFSLCLSDTTGLFLMGGAPPPSGRPGALTVPFQHGARALFSLRLHEIGYVGANFSETIHLPGVSPGSTQLHPTIVDSGTTFVYASTVVWRAMLNVIRPHLRYPEPGQRLCAFLTPGQLDALPRMYMRFREAPQRPLILTPQQYMVEFPRTGGRPGRHYCAGIFDNGRDGTVIGASIMRHRETIFDLSAGAITFIDSDCEHATPTTSNLANAFSFAGCPQPPDRASAATSRVRRGAGKPLGSGKASGAAHAAPAAASAAFSSDRSSAVRDASPSARADALAKLATHVRAAKQRTMNWLGGGLLHP